MGDEVRSMNVNVKCGVRQPAGRGSLCAEFAG